MNSSLPPRKSPLIHRSLSNIASAEQMIYESRQTILVTVIRSAEYPIEEALLQSVEFDHLSIQCFFEEERALCEPSSAPSQRGECRDQLCKLSLHVIGRDELTLWSHQIPFRQHVRRHGTEMAIQLIMSVTNRAEENEDRLQVGHLLQNVAEC